MTHSEFLNKLDTMFARYPLLEKSNPKSVNELVYVLRMDLDGDDYCLNVIDGNGGCMCIPSVKESFIPSYILICKIKGIEYDEEIFEEYGKHLVIIEAVEV